MLLQILLGMAIGLVAMGLVLGVVSFLGRIILRRHRARLRRAPASWWQPPAHENCRCHVEPARLPDGIILQAMTLETHLQDPVTRLPLARTDMTFDLARRLQVVEVRSWRVHITLQ